MAFSDKKKMTEYINKRNRENYDRIGVMAPKGEGDTIKAAAAAAGMSTNAYILEAVREKMTRAAPESVSNASESPSERVSSSGDTERAGTLENATEGG